MAAPQVPLLALRGYSLPQAQVVQVVVVVLLLVLGVVLVVPQQPTLMALPCLQARRLPLQ
jgi:hypothetical protein